MVNKKKWLIVVSIMSLLVSIAGCAKKPEDQQTTQASVISQLPEGHSTGTSEQPGNKESQTAVEKKINDLLNKKYPGDWKVIGTTLSKGTYTENGNYKIVDNLEKEFPDTMGVSIFVGEERISSSVKQGAKRVLKDYPTPATVGEVMKSGLTTSTLSNGYLKVFVPLKSGGKVLAVLTVSTPQS